MSLPKDIKTINKWLDEKFGHDLLGRPTYRIIWSTGELEKRKGVFADFYGSIFIREWYGVKEQPKYLYHPQWRDRWVLERMDYTPNPELVLDQAGHYEPLYVFYGAKGEYIRPTLRAIQWYMTKLFERVPWKTEAEKERNLDIQEQKEIDDEAEIFYGCIDDAYGGEIASAIRSKEGVVNPGVIYEPSGKPHFFNRGGSSASGNSREHTSVSSGSGSEAGTLSQ